MGFYIQVPNNFNKAQQLKELYDGEIISKPKSLSEIPQDKALIVVLRNFGFEAAGLAYSEKEFKEFTSPDDTRPKYFVLLDKKLAYELSGFKNEV